MTDAFFSFSLTQTSSSWCCMPGSCKIMDSRGSPSPGILKRSFGVLKILSHPTALESLQRELVPPWKWYISGDVIVITALKKYHQQCHQQWSPLTNHQYQRSNNSHCLSPRLTSSLPFPPFLNSYSKDIHVNPKVLIIVQGLGKVAPGQWARKLFTNGQRDQFDYASQIPYIERALFLGWAVILCDPNRAELAPAATAVQGPMSMWLGGGGGGSRSRGGPRGRADHVRRVWEYLIR